MPNLPSELLEALDSSMMVGEKKRITHEVCSKGKDACLSITRANAGWFYRCFRCGDDFSGFISAVNMSPQDTIAYMKRLESKPVETVPRVDLPDDFRPIGEKHYYHIDARIWLREYGITNKLMKKYNIGWSKRYFRVIFPVYKSVILYPSKDIAHKIVAWQGRNIYEVIPGQKPKWFLKKPKNIKRVYYECYAPESDKVVLVEDLVSAIKVHEATGYNTIALLTTYVSKELMMRLLKYKVFIWLDADMHTKSLGYSNTMNQLGIKTHAIIDHTKDPKEYSKEKINTYLS